jgi:hypothetical protein
MFDPSTGTWYLRNVNSAGAPTILPFHYGAAGWVPLSGYYRAAPQALLATVVGLGRDCRQGWERCSPADARSRAW